MHKLKKFLLEKYEISVVNKKTYKQAFSKQITKLHILLIILTFFISNIVIIYLLVNHVPAFRKIFLKPELISSLSQQKELNNKIKILEAQLKEQEEIINFLQNTFDISTKNNTTPEKKDNINELIKEPINTIVLAKETINKKTNPINNELLVLPVNGTIVKGCNYKEAHFGIDIGAKEGTPVLATASGRVIFAEYSYETGYVIIIQHNNNLISVYKHNSRLNKQLGDKVKKGEIIAFVGSSGEYSTGPHLHFELWYNGTFIDPQLLWKFN